MKLFISITTILFLLLFQIALVSAACLTPSDSYATEVMLNKPGIESNLNSLSSAQNILIKDNKYIIQSSYDPNMALILERQTEPVNGLSIKIQIPVRAAKLDLPYLKLVSTSVDGAINLTNLSADSYFNGWKISCIEGDPTPQCEISKGKTSLLASSVSSKKYEVTMETNENLETCKDCGGECIHSGTESRCITRAMEQDMVDVLKYLGLVRSNNELFIYYRVLSLGKVTKTDLSPEVSLEVNWQEAMNEDLTYLKQTNIITIDDRDIEQISSLAREGAAGQNSRIVYDKENEKWAYYYETDFPTLTKIVTCNEFPVSLVPRGTVSYSPNQISTYYLVPIAITITFFFLLVFLIVIARLIDSKKRKNIAKLSK